MAGLCQVMKEMDISMMAFWGKHEFYNFMFFPWALDKIPTVS